MKSKSGNINYPVLYFWNTVCGKWLTQGWINKISIHGKWLTQGWINKISIHGKWLTQGWINKISIHGKWLTQSWIGKIIQDIPILKKNKIKIKLQCFIQTFMVNKPLQVFSLCLCYVYAMKYPIGSTDQKTFIHKMILNSKTVCNCDMHVQNWKYTCILTCILCEVLNTVKTQFSTSKRLKFIVTTTKRHVYVSCFCYLLNKTQLLMHSIFV